MEAGLSSPGSEPSFMDWMRVGMENGWCGPSVCYTHDGLPLSEAEEGEFEEHDPCIHIIRLYPDAETGAAVVANHSPSSWRNPFRALS